MDIPQVEEIFHAKTNLLLKGSCMGMVLDDSLLNSQNRHQNLKEDWLENHALIDALFYNHLRKAKNL
jgi:hypothetical protein